MCFLDERVVDAYAKQLPDKRFFFLPDITYSELPHERGVLAQNIAHHAAGRRIVFLGGTIVKSKNLSAWFRLIAQADPRQWYFVQIGEVRWDELDPQERQALRTAIDNPPENLFIHDGYLPDERAFNEIIQGSDILFAVYRDFRISSNMLGKSAAFNKPILVADNHLMGARVIRYGIGNAVPEDDAQAMLRSLDQLAGAGARQSSEGFEAYRKDFGREALSAQLDKLIDLCCAKSFKGRPT
jgi:glycosyltransferase involved in cell wall biosynthesis